MATIQKVSGIDFANISKFDGVDISAVGSINLIGKPATGTLLLDTTYGSGAEAAYSVRKLRTAYTGAAMQVQATTGGATAEIGFDVNGNLDTATLLAFAGTNEVGVSIWYDQSLNLNNAVQISVGSRPIVVAAGGALVKRNGRLAVNFLGNDNFPLPTNSLPSNINNASSFLVYDFDTTASGTVSYIALALGRNSPNQRWYQPFVYNNTNLEYFSYGNSLTGNLIKKPDDFVHLLTAIAGSTQGDARVFADGTLTTTTSLQSAVPPEGSIGGFASSTNHYKGTMQEIVIYDNDKSSVRTSIEENIGDYYTQNQAPYLLDTYTDAAAAYSLRKLRTNYTGFAIKVQDNVGGATQDIGFNVFGELDTVSLSQYAGSNDVFVVTWFDQSGSGNNATQGTSTARPKIYDGVTGVVTDNRKPAVQFDGTNDILGGSSITSTDDLSMMLVNTWTGGQQFNFLFGQGRGFPGGTETNTDFYMGIFNGNPDNVSFGVKTTNATPNWANTSYTSSNIQNAQTLHTGYYKRNANMYFYRNGSLQDSRTTYDGAIQNLHPLKMGSSFEPQGLFQEAILYPSDESATRTGIETNINTFYDIYTPTPDPLLLNLYPGSSAAYSLRKLNANYTGSAIKVQDTVGGATKAIGFDANGDLDTAELLAYAGSNDVFVETWYDQSGNGNDAEQPSSGLRPQIVSSGVVEVDGTKPTIEFSNAGSSNLIFTLISDIQTIFTVRSSSDVGARTNFMGASATNDYRGANNVLLSGAAASYVTGGNNYINGALTNYTTTQKPTTQSLFTLIHTSASGRSNYLTQDRGNGGRSWRGPFSELIIYNSDQDAAGTRPSIEDNVGDYYGIEIAGILDQYSGAAAGYSLRKLSNSYTGFAVKVQDTVGGATQDIGFNADGELDTVALLAYAGSNDVFVETWYDQSGNGNNAEQISSGARPQIVRSGVVIVDANGKPAVEFDGSNDFITSSFTASAQPVFYAFVFAPDSTTAKMRVFDGNGSDSLNNRNNLVLESSSIYSLNAGNTITGGTTTANQQLISIDLDTSNSFVYKNGAQIISGNAGTRGVNSIRLGTTPTAANQFFDGTMQEVILWDSDQFATRTGIETNINAFYAIY